MSSFFRGFNRSFEWVTEGYVKLSGLLIRRAAISLLLLAAVVAATWWFNQRLPSGFMPDEDQGYLLVNVQLKDASSLQLTDAACKDIEKILADTPGIAHYTTVVGFSLLSTVNSTYNAFFFVNLKPWHERTRPEEQYAAISAHLNRELARLPKAISFAFSPPAIPGVGRSGGVTFILQDRSGGGGGGGDQGQPGTANSALAQNVPTFMAAASKRPELLNVSTTYLPATPQVFAHVDRDKALKLGVPLEDVYRTVQAFMGGFFVNFFNRFGRQWQVYVQAEGEFRTRAENIGQFYVRNNQGQMVPLSTLVTFQPISGPEFTMRFNEYSCAQINAAAAPGYSSAQAMAALEETFAQTMPPEMGYDYLGMSFQEKKAQKGVPAAAVYALSLLFVFLILAAQYESWSLPFSVLLSTPFAVMGAFGALLLRRWASPIFENNVYAQIGVVMLIGLAAKNAILIVQFAKMELERSDGPEESVDGRGSSVESRKGSENKGPDPDAKTQEDRGDSAIDPRHSTLDPSHRIADAALTGARIRLRPILMTSFAMILGLAPLVVASGAGAIARRILGTVILGGLLAATCIAVFLIPFTFYLVESLVARFARRK